MEVLLGGQVMEGSFTWRTFGRVVRRRVDTVLLRAGCDRRIVSGTFHAESVFCRTSMYS